MRALWRRFHFLLFIAAGIGIMASGVTYYLSPMTRLQLYGVKLEHRVALRAPTRYLLGWHTQVESWSERDGRLDTPLLNETSDEVSTVVIERRSGMPAQTTLQVRPQEWIRSMKNADGFNNQTLPLHDVSILPGTVVLDKEGTLVERRATSAWRVMRALPFIFPTFPKGILRRGDSWKERIEWTEFLHDWKIYWRADLRWSLRDFDIRYGKPCAHLVYEAVLTPTVLQGPEWAKTVKSAVPFNGQASGDAVYDIPDKFLISNSLSYAGTLKIHIPNLADIPYDLRIGNALPPGPGDVVLKISDTMDARLP